MDDDEANKRTPSKSTCIDAPSYWTASPHFQQTPIQEDLFHFQLATN
jgi:hypothetical protein